MRTSGKISVITLWDYMHRFPESLHSQSSPDIDCYQYDCERQEKNMNHGPVGYFVLDYRIKGYYYVGRNIKNLFGFPPEAFMEGGILFCHHQMVKEDLEVFSTAAFPSRLLLIQSVKDELEQYWFSINYRLKRMDGKTIQVLQQFTVLEADEQGLPLVIFGYCMDISDYKQDNKIVDSVYRRDKDNGLVCLSKTLFYPESEEDKLSHREREILKWIAEGCSSKCIADKLFLSTHTVNTHRRNMLEKTHSKNTADLLKFAFSRGLV